MKERYKRHFKEENKWCKFYILNTKNCSIGCEEIFVTKGDICPFFTSTGQKENCPCYEA